MEEVGLEADGMRRSALDGAGPIPGGKGDDDVEHHQDEALDQWKVNKSARAVVRRR